MHRFDFSVVEYDLRKTLESGQTFFWQSVSENSWESVFGGRVVRLTQSQPDQIMVHVQGALGDMRHELSRYLQVEVDLGEVLRHFPNDPLLRQAVASRRGLRLLRQDPWTCLASFILSSNKRIPQIMEVVGLIATRIGETKIHPETARPLYAFPSPEKMASSGEAILRECKAGYRARYLHQCAALIASGAFPLNDIFSMNLEDARAKLMELPGVGGKIADCVLLFAFGFARAFPIDVWVQKVLSDYYFKGKNPPRRSLESFVKDYFGKHAGFAQQYLFDYIRHLKPSEWAEWIDLN